MTSVCSLLFLGGPPAVFWRVVSIVVYAVQGFFPWSKPHVFKKVFKEPPPITDRNAAPLVSMGSWVTVIRDSTNHVVPRHIGWRHYSPSCMSVVPPWVFAATAFRHASNQFIGWQQIFCSTYTPTEPQGSVSYGTLPPDHSPVVKSLSLKMVGHRVCSYCYRGIITLKVRRGNG
jgi:uncharacterized protein YneF (UPF0154 family)